MWKGPEEFFTYTKNQRNAIVLLLGMVIAFFAIYRFWDFQRPSDSLDPIDFQKMVAEWEERKEIEGKEIFLKSLFIFDPNSASNADFKKLGLESFQIKRIKNFIKKGGRFSNPNDLLKIYGIDSNWVFTVMPHIRIEGRDNPKDDSVLFSPHSFNPNLISKSEMMAMGFNKQQTNGIIAFRQKVYPFKNLSDLYKVYALDSSFVNSISQYLIFPDFVPLNQKKAIVKVDLNRIDSIEIKNINEVPVFLLERIVKYRNQLGGFYSLDQLEEVYGVDSVFHKKIKDQVFVNQDLVIKQDLNTSTFRELLKHPYLNYEQVKSIVNFRQKIRLFESVDELNNLELINDSLFTKIANYLEVGKNK